ncbi:MAG: T9SS type A sorting domain-containing protein [Saprospiraceae bacterium]
MKNSFTKFFLVLFSLFIFSNSYTQTFPYFLEIETDTYTDLEGATELTSVGDNWDDPDYTIPIGFNFDFYGNTYSTIFISGLGSWLVFEDIYTTDSIEVLIPYFDDLADIENVNPANQSTISYSIEGAAGQQILKIQWKDCGFYEEIFNMTSPTANNTISFQAWLYEGSNNIEVRFGPSTLPDAATIHDYGSPVCGMIENISNVTDEFEAFWHLTGEATNPTITSSDVTVLDTYSIPGLDSDPASGQVYRFATVPTSIKLPTQTLDLNVYPTAVTDEFFVEVNEEILNEKTQISVVNNLGQVIYNNTIANTKERLDASNFPSGIYYVRIHNENGIGTKKIIKN